MSASIKSFAFCFRSGTFGVGCRAENIKKIAGGQPVRVSVAGRTDKIKNLLSPRGSLNTPVHNESPFITYKYIVIVLLYALQ